MIPLTILNLSKTRSVELHKQLFLEFVKTHRYWGFFPNLKMIVNNENIPIYPSISKYCLPNIDGNLVFDYFDIDYEYEAIPLINSNIGIYSKKQRTLLIGNNESSFTDFTYNYHLDFGFSLSSESEFWFQEAQYSGKSFDNSFLAYHNTPRLNSFIRDLKDIWVNKYNWTFDIERGYPGVSEIGEILLDGKIIYQEDVDEGKVILPSVNEYLK